MSGIFQTTSHCAAWRVLASLASRTRNIRTVQTHRCADDVYSHCYASLAHATTSIRTPRAARRAAASCHGPTQLNSTQLASLRYSSPPRSALALFSRISVARPARRTQTQTQRQRASGRRHDAYIKRKAERKPRAHNPNHHHYPLYPIILNPAI